MAVGGDDDVGGFEVAMDEALVVRALASPRAICTRESDQCGTPAAGRAVSFARSVSPSTHSITATIRRLSRADVVDGDEVGVGECGERLAFADESRTRASGSVARWRGQDFDGDGAVQAGVVGAIHLAHPAFAELGDRSR